MTTLLYACMGLAFCTFMFGVSADDESLKEAAGASMAFALATLIVLDGFRK